VRPTFCVYGRLVGELALAKTLSLPELEACSIGDENRDGVITIAIDELIVLVNIALGNAEMSECDTGDANNDGQITVEEILAGVNNALNGC
jgi:hypothetical protein